MPGDLSKGGAYGQGPDPSRANSSQDPLYERIRSATAVVAGTVREVRKPTQAVSSAASDMSVTEHSPMLAEAVIAVKAGIKGASDGDEVVVRFPTSTDVMWRNYPKFQEGQTGVFVLQPDLSAGMPESRSRESQTRAYSVRQRGDVLPLAEEGRIRLLSD